MAISKESAKALTYISTPRVSKKIFLSSYVIWKGMNHAEIKTLRGGDFPVTHNRRNKSHIGVLLLILPLVLCVPIQAAGIDVESKLKSHGVLQYTDETTGDSVLLDSQDLHVLAQQIELLPDAYYEKGYKDGYKELQGSIVITWEPVNPNPNKYMIYAWGGYHHSGGGNSGTVFFNSNDYTSAMKRIPKYASNEWLAANCLITDRNGPEPNWYMWGPKF